MLNYVSFLFNELENLPEDLKAIRNKLINNSEDYKVIVNCILNTELVYYLNNILDYKQIPYEDINTSYNIYEIDNKVKSIYIYITEEVLRNYALMHFSPIWRISALALFYLIKADSFYRSKS